ncbi:MAG: hypothetical protein HW399_333 [Dehalococcoidia bacterium]|nr:hypothetical protein [Dehalococcoidia bacterium]
MNDSPENRREGLRGAERRSPDYRDFVALAMTGRNTLRNIPYFVNAYEYGVYATSRHKRLKQKLKIYFFHRPTKYLSAKSLPVFSAIL